VIIADEIYARLAFDAPVASIASLPGLAERTVICDGFSKTYAMTGCAGLWHHARGAAERVELLLTHSIGCTATFTQYAGLEAVLGPQDQVDAMVAEYKRRRDKFVAGLNAIPGVKCRSPQGAFYAFPTSRPSGRRRNGSPTTCWRKRAWRCCPARTLARAAKATCACASPLDGKLADRFGADGPCLGKLTTR